MSAATSCAWSSVASMITWILKTLGVMPRASHGNRHGPRPTPVTMPTRGEWLVFSAALAIAAALGVFVFVAAHTV